LNSQSVPRAIFLDLDDTILDFSGGVDAGWTIVCHEVADRAQGVDAGKLKAAIYQVRDSFWADPELARAGRKDLRDASRRIVQEALTQCGISAPPLAKEIAERYRDVREEGLALFPGALEALDRLKVLGVRLALLTNGTSSDQRAKLQRFDLAKYFDCICIEGELGFGKPDERVFDKALRTMLCRPEDASMVGDNLVADIIPAMTLGIEGIWLDRLAAGPPPGTAPLPDRIIRALGELP
jgi:putative hydrolase of the HAD superfamily